MGKEYVFAPAGSIKGFRTPLVEKRMFFDFHFGLQVGQMIIVFHRSKAQTYFQVRFHKSYRAEFRILSSFRRATDNDVILQCKHLSCTINSARTSRPGPKNRV
jgi:hypothetical protein